MNLKITIGYPLAAITAFSYFFIYVTSPIAILLLGHDVNWENYYQCGYFLLAILVFIWILERIKN